MYVNDYIMTFWTQYIIFFTSKSWLFFSNICGFPYFCDGLDEQMDADQQRLDSICFLHFGQHWLGHHDCHEHHSVLPSAAERLHPQKRIHDQRRLNPLQKLFLDLVLLSSPCMFVYHLNYCCCLLDISCELFWLYSFVLKWHHISFKYTIQVQLRISAIHDVKR